MTFDEFTILLLAAEGESLAPIGRWKQPILDLAERGLMRKDDEVNYVITQDGRRACDEQNAADERALSDVLARSQKTIEARAEDIVEVPKEGDVTDE